MSKFRYSGKDHGFARKMGLADGGPSDDYDYAAAKAAGVQPAANGHWPDTYKKPNHITFSDQSRGGGSWDKIPNDNWMFTPGPTNFKQHSVPEYQKYFGSESEPDALVKLPDARVTGQ